MRRLASTLVCLASPTLSLACADDGPIEAEASAAVESSETRSSTTDPGDGDPSPGDGDGDPGDGDGDGDPTPGDGDGDPGDGDGDPREDLVRFVAIGDAGEGNQGQFNVAAAVESVCADAGGCEFVLYLGDNFYSDGVGSVDDDQFSTKFELPYADLDMPFYVVMGNHDYGLLGISWAKVDYEVEYTNYSDKWTMPSKWYTVDAYDEVAFFMMDTARLMWNYETGAQQSWLDQAIAGNDKRWKIAVGHHPYFSNGAHGNAGNYEGVFFPPQLAGTDVEEVLSESLCGRVDLYLCGHDHNRQWHQRTCGGGDRTTHFVVNGAGCKITPFAYHDDNPVYWEDDTSPGFMVLELAYDRIHTEFYDESGTMQFARDITK